MSKSTRTESASSTKKPKLKQRGYFFSKLGRTIFADSLEKATVEAQRIET